MPRPSKQLTPEEAQEIRLNPPPVLNTYKAAAVLEKSIRTIREMFNEKDFPVMKTFQQSSKKNTEKYVLRDDLFEWMKMQGRLR